MLAQWDGRRRYANLRKLARLARNYDLVHCTEWDASLWGRMAAVLARRPTIVTEHTLDRGIQVSESGSSRGRAIALHHKLLGPSTCTHLNDLLRSVADAEALIEQVRRA